MRLKETRGQGMLEIVLVFAVVIAAILGMQVFLKRAVEGRLRSSADSVGTQWDPINGTYKVINTSTSSRVDTVSTDGFSRSLATAAKPDIQRQETDGAQTFPASAGKHLFTDVPD
jgi:hypothetical protein